MTLVAGRGSRPDLVTAGPVASCSYWSLRIRFRLLKHLLVTSLGTEIVSGPAAGVYGRLRGAQLRGRAADLIEALDEVGFGDGYFPAAFRFAGSYLKDADPGLGVTGPVECLADNGLMCTSGRQCLVASAAIQIACLHQLYETLVDSIHGDIAQQVNVSRLIAWMDILREKQLAHEVGTRLFALEPLLEQDPAGVYLRMSTASKSSYRICVDALAAKAGVAQKEVILASLGLALEGSSGADSAARSHIGYYIAGGGRKALLEDFSGAHAEAQWRRSLHVPPLEFLTLVWAASLVTCGFLVWLTPMSIVPWSLAAGALISVASTNAEGFNEQFRGLRRCLGVPRDLPALRSEDEEVLSTPAIVAVSALLSARETASEMLERASATARALAGTNVRVCLLMDFPDSRFPGSSRSEQALLAWFKETTETANKELARDGSLPMTVLFRNRVFSRTDQKWYGAGRKSGKIKDLLELATRGSGPMRILVGEQAAIRDVRYAILFDEDTKATRESILALIAAALHPLNRPKMNKQTGSVASGFAAMAPFTSTRSPMTRRPFARLLSGAYIPEQQRGRLNDSNFDLFGERQFSGKGLIDVGVAANLLPRVIDSGKVLSHDYVEGSFLRCGFTPNAIFHDSHEATHEALSRREERWCRGDFQNLLMLCLPVRAGFSLPPQFGRFLILQNGHRSSSELLFLVGLLSVVAVPGALPIHWQALVVLIPLLHENLSFAARISCGLGRGRWSELSGFIHVLLDIHVRFFVRIASAPSRGLIMFLAWARSLERIFSGRNLLDWVPFGATFDAGPRFDRVIGSPYLSLLLAGPLLLLHWDRLGGSGFAMLILCAWSLGPALFYLEQIRSFGTGGHRASESTEV